MIACSYRTTLIEPIYDSKSKLGLIIQKQFKKYHTFFLFFFFSSHQIHSLWPLFCLTMDEYNSGLSLMMSSNCDLQGIKLVKFQCVQSLPNPQLGISLAHCPTFSPSYFLPLFLEEVSQLGSSIMNGYHGTLKSKSFLSVIEKC